MFGGFAVSTEDPASDYRNGASSTLQQYLPLSKTDAYRQVSRQLRDDLAAGRYGQEGRLPSEVELARRFSVSRPTVARTL